MTITSAIYADPTGKQKQDITKYVQQAYASGLPALTLDSREGAQGQNPAPGVKKQTTITFSVRGQAKTLTFPEGSRLKFDSDLK